MVDATGATVDNEAELVAASARFSCPLASSYLAVSVQDLMAADTCCTFFGNPLVRTFPRPGQPNHLARAVLARPPFRWSLNARLPLPRARDGS